MEEKPAKYRQILDAATELFLEHGLKEVSISQIVKTAGCSRETVYRYFKSKDEIFSSALANQIDSYLDVMESINTGASGDLRTGLLNWTIALLEGVTAEEYIKFRRLVISEARSQPEHAQLYFHLTYERGVSAATEFFKKQQKEGHLRDVDPKRLTQYFVGMLLYDPVHRRVLGIDKPLSRPKIQKMAKTVVEDFIEAFGTEQHL